jgi:tetratricopeptide (TPR) repeat protein
MARLDRLTGDKIVAQVASVIGRKFTGRLLAAALEVPDADCLAALDRLTRDQLVVRRGSTANPSYMFRHALIRDAAYHSLLRRQQRQWHARIVGALERTEPATVATQPELVARHHQESGDAEAALKHWSAAADLAERRAAPREAAQHYETALALVRQAPETPQTLGVEFDLLRGLARVARQTDGWNTERVRQIEQRIIDIARRLDRADTVLAHSLLASFRARLAKGDYGEGIEAFTSVPWGLDQIAPSDRQPLLFMAALNNFAIGDFARAQAQAFEALELSQLMPPDPGRHFAGWSPEIALRAQLCQGLRVIGQLARAAAMSAEALTIAEALQDRLSQALALYQQALTAETQGQWPEMLALAERACGLAESLAAAPTAALARQALGRARVATGDVKGGVADIQLGLERMRAIFGAVQLCWAMALAVHVLLTAGAFEPARELLARAEKTQAATHDRSMAAEFRRMRGVLAVRDGALDDAEAVCRAALALAESQGARLFTLRAAVDLARLLRRDGRSEEARAVLRPAYDPLAAEPDCPELVEARAMLQLAPAA